MSIFFFLNFISFELYIICEGQVWQKLLSSHITNGKLRPGRCILTSLKPLSFRVRELGFEFGSLVPIAVSAQHVTSSSFMVMVYWCCHVLLTLGKTGSKQFPRALFHEPGGHCHFPFVLIYSWTHIEAEYLKARIDLDIIKDILIKLYHP